MKTEEAIDAWLTAVRSAGKSKATVRKYSWQLRNFIARTNATETDAITRTMLRAWSADLRDDWQPATVRNAVVAIRSFLRFCAEEEITPRDLSNVLRVPPVPERIQRAVDADEVGRLLEVAGQPPTRGLTEPQAAATSARNCALIALMFDTILRAAEVVSLDVTSVDYDRQFVTVIGKGGKQRRAGYGPDTADLLTAWLHHHPHVATDPAALFVAITGNTPGARLTTNGLRVILRKLAKKAGIPHLSPHAFRRGGATEALRNNAPTRVVQLHGGWTRINKVETYSRNLNALEEMRKYGPMKNVRNGNNHEPEQ
ncbi:MAG: tyrosine-type recombinase/integrase [Caldilineaceae bacterium]|nr:tyrosine-type recombinase/integrase [Caldilineaceae bacterium]